MPLDKFPKQDSALDKEIHIRVSPRRVLRSFLFILILVSVFYLGRWSVSPPDASISGLSVNWFSHDATNDTAPVAKPATIPKPTPTATVATPTVTQPAAAPVPAETALNAGTASNVTYVATYTKVALALSDVVSEWKGTYGKITQIKFTIINNEAGPIKADHFGMLVEGYDDFEKKIPLPASLKVINAGETKEAILNVPQGFAYSDVTAGDLNDVKITLKLLDENGKQVAIYEKTYKLKSS